MKSSGVVRKIDDLGRIVIPKEIRRSLGIRDGESLEIIVEDSNIVLFKKNIINNYIEESKLLCDVAKDCINGCIIVTNRDSIKYVSDEKYINLLNNKLPSELIDIIDNRLIEKSNNIIKYVFSGMELTGYFIIYPIINESNSLGLVILYSSNPIMEYEIIIKYLSLLLARKMDISC